MLLIYTPKITPRVEYSFKHICKRILNIEIGLTNDENDFRSYEGAKISYGKKPLDAEVFFQSAGFLEQQGIETVEIIVKPWEETFCFFSVSQISSLPFDIFSASFYMLSRYEEYLPHVKDEKGRFTAVESLAHKEGFLMQPVVDIWAYKFRNVLLAHFPELLLETKPKEMSITSLIEASEPFIYAQKGIFRTIVGVLTDLLNGKFRKLLTRTKVILRLKRDPYDTFKWIVNTLKHSNFKVIVFFMLGEATSINKSMNFHRKKLKLLIKYINDYTETGLIFSFKSLKNPELLKKEKKHLESITHRAVQSSINAELLVNLPEIYRQLIELEVRNDYTMVFSDMPGFRAGTCTPFLFYDLDYEVKTPLLLHPVAAHTQMFSAAKYSNSKERTVNELLKAVASVNGHFLMIFSNKDFSSDSQSQIWKKIFSEKLNSYN